jgi:predicted ATPase/DNA-binding SARP family transcriptional activator
VDFRLLGALEVESAGRDLTPARWKQKLLLAALVLRANEVVATDELIEILWGSAPPASAPKALHGHVSALRKLLGAKTIVTRRPGYLLSVEAGSVDAERFEVMVDAAREENDPARRRDQLGAALALFRGEPLVDFRYEPFAGVEAARLEAVRLNAIEQRIEAELELGGHHEVLAELERLVAEHPHEERLSAALMLALYRAGRQAQALEVFAEGRRRLVDELGLEPGPALLELERQILNHDPALLAAPREEAAVGRERTNLPPQATELIGRERDLAELRRLLREGGRLWTLTGPAGAGKTRLAVAAAAGLRERFPGGTFFVPLAPVADSALVPAAIADAVGADRAQDGGSFETLESSLAGKSLLLVLDNFEHLLTAAPGVSRLVAAVRDLAVLVTSREPLHVEGERVYPVPPLALPGRDELDDVADSPAVKLFVERAQALRPEFELSGANAAAVAGICRRLDGLPLAIELAAARLPLFPPAALLGRLDERLKLLTSGGRDQPERHQTLRAAIDWSHRLLSDSQRTLLARLSVFAGGWTLAAAEVVCVHDGDLIDGLGSLVDKNLVRLERADDEPRFTMLETIREYAAERLAAGPDADAVRRRHADFLTKLAREARGLARGPDEQRALDRVTAELDNVRAALRWTIDRGERARGLALAEALEPFWYRRTLWREGLSWLEQLLALPGEVPPDVRAGSLLTAGRLALELGDHERARPWYDEAERLARELGDEERLAWALHGLGHGAWRDGDLDRARALLTESAERFAALGQHGPAGGRYTYLAALEQEAGDSGRARELLERSIEAYDRAGDRAGVAGSTAGLGDLELAAGRAPEALARYSTALPVHAEQGEPYTTAACLGAIAAAAATLGRHADASRLWGAVERLEHEGGFILPEFDRAFYLRLLGEPDAEEAAAGRTLPTAAAVALAESLSAAFSMH